jgi:hypothetical protein
MADEERTEVTDATRDEQAAEAAAAHRADRAPTAEEEAEADAAAKGGLDPDVVAHERDMTERGANVKGEGEIG